MSNTSDPRLRAFARQAVAIVAAHGGLNMQSQARLRSLARQLRMSEEEFSQAIKELQLDNDPNAQLSRYEQNFVKFLRRSFQAFPSKILALPWENRAIKLAETKYQISLPRARQLLESVCEQLEIKRVSLSEAEALIEQSIDDGVADLPTISDSLKEHFYELGANWGVTRERVDEFLAHKIAANQRMERLDRRRRFGKRLLAAGTILGALAMIAVMWFAGKAGSLETTVTMETEPSNLVELPKRWLPESIINPDRKLSAGVRELASFCQRLEQVSDSPSRQAQYHELFTRVATLTPPDIPVALDLLTEVATADPDFDAQWFTKSWIHQWLSVDESGGRLLQIRRRSIAWQVLATAVRIAGANLPDWLAAFIESELSLKIRSLPVESRSTAIKQRWLLTEWQRTLGLADGDPDQVASQVHLLLTLDGYASHRPEYLEMANRVIVRSLVRTLNSSVHAALTPHLAALVQSADDQMIEAWLELADRQTSSSFQLEVWKAIALRLGLPIPPEQAEESFAKAMRLKKNELRNARLAPIIAINDYAADLEREFLRQARNWRLPELEYGSIAAWGITTMQVANVSLLALAAAERRLPSQMLSEGFRKAERGLFAEMPLPQLPVYVATTVAAAEDSRAVASLLIRLNDTDPLNELLRIDALKQLAQRSVTINSASPRDVLPIARFYLRALTLAERIAAEQSIQSFSQWPTFLLALADEVDSAQLSADEARSLLQLLTDIEFQFADQERWQQEFKQTLHELARRKLESRIGEEIFVEQQQWKNLQRTTWRSYRFRSERLTGQLPQETKLATLIHSIAQSLAGSATVLEFPIAMHATDKGRESGLSEIVNCQYEFLQVLASRHGTVSPTESSSRRAELAGLKEEQQSAAKTFLALELLFLKWLSQDRAATMKRLLDTGGW